MFPFYYRFILFIFSPFILFSLYRFSSAISARADIFSDALRYPFSLCYHHSPLCADVNLTDVSAL